MHNFSTAEINEIKSCFENAEYFIEKYCFLSHPTNGIIRMVPNSHQRLWFRTVENNKITMLGVERQTGRTQFIAAHALWNAMFKESHTVGVFAHTYICRKEILDKILFMYSMLPQFLRLKIDSYDRTSINFANGSTIRFLPINETSGRGLTLGTIFVDNGECVPSRELNDFFSAVYPCSPPMIQSKWIMTGRSLWPE